MEFYLVGHGQPVTAENGPFLNLPPYAVIPPKTRVVFYVMENTAISSSRVMDILRMCKFR